MSIYEHFEHAQNIALLEIQTLVLICQPCLQINIVILCRENEDQIRNQRPQLRRNRLILFEKAMGVL